MGCFNKIGFYSHLPITFENNIVYFICIKYHGYAEENTPISPYGKLSPLCLPIFGKYDDYGSIMEIQKDNHVEYLEKVFNLPINDIIEAIELCSGVCLSNINENERLHHDSFQKRTNNYISILNTIKNIFLPSKVFQFEEKFSLTYTMELYDVYSFLVNEYQNSKSHEILNSICNIVNDNNLHYINIFQKYASYSYDDTLDDLKCDTINKLNVYHDLNKLLMEYSSYSGFNRNTLGALVIYGINNFDFYQNILLINNFTNFCLALILNCRNFDVSEYGNQDILSQCDMMIKEHEEFVKILKDKKKDVE